LPHEGVGFLGKIINPNSGFCRLRDGRELNDRPVLDFAKSVRNK
jgi:hypothetical protein